MEKKIEKNEVNTETTAEKAVCDTAALKEKYGTVYSLGMTIPLDDDTEKKFEFKFKKPTMAAYDRFVKRAKDSITKASKTFTLDCVIEEDRERLKELFEEYPAAPTTITNKLVDLIGGIDGGTLTML